VLSLVFGGDRVGRRCCWLNISARTR